MTLPPLRTALTASSLLWLGFCLVLTWQNGQQTLSVSRWLTDVVVCGLNEFNIHLDAVELEVSLRHWAHFVLFAIFGLLFWGGVGVHSTGRRAVKFRLFMAVLTLGLAFAAEIPKEWIEGRDLTWSEAWLNSFGALCGIALAQLIAVLFKGVTKRRVTKGRG